MNTRNRGICNKESGLYIQRLASPSYGFVSIAQEIGFRAWSESASNVSGQEIEITFASSRAQRERHAQRDLAIMEAKAKMGKFAGAVAVKRGEPVGYAWASDDISADKVQRLIRQSKGRKPYAQIVQVNVLPEHQNQGIGTSLAVEALRSFDADQRSSVYVFDENYPAINWLESLGYSHRPVTPESSAHYLGEDNPASQSVFAVPSIQHVRDAVRAHLIRG